MVRGCVIVSQARNQRSAFPMLEVSSFATPGSGTDRVPRSKSGGAIFRSSFTTCDGEDHHPSTYPNNAIMVSTLVPPKVCGTLETVCEPS